MPYEELRKGRISLPEQIYHVTMVCDGRRPLFTEATTADIVVAELKQAAKAEVNSLAWVVMPDHVHWLLQIQALPLSTVIKRFKGRAARTINLRLDRSGPVWQRSFHDHAIRRDEDLKATARYIVANPLRAGLVDKIADYPWWWAAWAEDGDAVVSK